MQSPKSILNPAFRYIPSAETDIRKTFARIKRQQEKQKTNVSTLKLKKA